MFYLIDEEIKEISFDGIDENKLVAGYIGTEELQLYGERLGFSQPEIDTCMTESTLFRTDVVVHENYTFTEMRIAYENSEDDCIALFIKNNLMLVVNVRDTDCSVINNLKSTLYRFPVHKLNTARLACSFMESLVSGGNMTIEMLRNEISKMEENVIKGDTDSEFSINLLEIKKKLMRLHNYYCQLLDIAEALEENENDIFEDSQLIYASNLTNRFNRLRDDVDSLRNETDHLQDAYSASLDMQLNTSMKFFTVLTTVFFPLTIIVGWYGMNFSSMPEFTWKYGYVFVIALSVLTVSGLVLLGKKQKWF